MRMKHVPDDSDVRNRTRSAGTLWFFSRSMRSPTRKDDEGTERVLAYERLQLWNGRWDVPVRDNAGNWLLDR